MSPQLSRYVVNVRALRLRASPSLDSPITVSLPRGTVVQLIDEASPASSWVHVVAGKRIGWMARKYLTPEDHQAAPPSALEEFPWSPSALGELGVREVAGAGNDPRVLEYLRSTDLDPTYASEDSTPWCSGLVNWCVEKSGHAGTNSAAARSWLDWGRPITIPRRGVIAVFKRGALGGHVGFFVRKDTERIWVLGGNQTNEVSIAGFDPQRLLGYRLPAR